MAITVSVRFHNMLRHYAGLDRESVVLPDGTALRDALAHLAGKHDPGLARLLLAADGTMTPHLVVFCNGQLVPRDRGDAVLADGDELLLFPAISGG